MASLKRRLSRLILVISILTLAATWLNAQTVESKTKPNGSISGRVTIGDKPAPGILISVSAPNSMTAVIQTTTSDADGNYRLSGLADGQINVTPVAPVYVIPSSPMFGQGRIVNLSPNEAVEGIDFKLTRGGVITGRITDADGRPVIEERVSLISVDDNGAPVRGPSIRPSNFMMYQTDDRGVYRVYGLPAGHYKISAGLDSGGAGIRMAGSYQRVFYPDATELNKAGIVDVSEGGETKNIDIKLGRRTATYSISGRIVDADSGQPLVGVYFSVGSVQTSQNQSFVNSTTGPANPTNSLGEFRLEGLQSGRYIVTVNSSNFNPNAAQGPRFYNDPVPFEILDADVTNLEIQAHRGLTISGVVLPDGITDKSVLARMSKLMVTGRVDPGAKEIRTFLTNSVSKINPDGSFTLEGLQPGRVTIEVAAFNAPDSGGFAMARIESNAALANREIELPPGQNVSGVKIYVAYGTGVIRGQVKAEGGVLPSDTLMIVSVNRQGELSRFSGQVDSRGRFMIRGVSSGTYEVVLQIISLGSQQLPRGFPRQQRQTVSIVDGSDTEVSFTLDVSRKDVP